MAVAPGVTTVVAMRAGGHGAGVEGSAAGDFGSGDCAPKLWAVAGRQSAVGAQVGVSAVVGPAPERERDI